MDTRTTDPLPPLPSRDPRGHKGTFGTVAVVGGCATNDRRMIGAPALSALGALRSGAGLVRLAAPGPVLDATMTITPSATGVPLPTDSEGHLLAHEAAAALDTLVRSCDCLVIGPGLGEGAGPQTASLRSVQQEEVPVIVDADALNALAAIPELHRDFRAAAVLTPHPGEYRRLAASLNIAHDPVRPESRPAAAEALAQRLGCVVVLKGSGTVVSDGQRTWVNPSGNAALATAGTGDVLAGVIGALAAQFVVRPGSVHALAAARLGRRPPDKPLDLFDAARLAVYAHGLAGERWSERRGAAGGLLAAELADELPEVLESLRAGG